MIPAPFFRADAQSAEALSVFQPRGEKGRKGQEPLLGSAWKEGGIYRVKSLRVVVAWSMSAVCCKTAERSEVRLPAK